MSAPPDVLDLRLVPAALTAWLVALLVVRVPAVLGLALTVLLALLAALALAGAGARGRRVGGGNRGGGAILVLLVAAGVLLSGAAQVGARQSGQLLRAATDGDQVTVTGRVTQEPRPLAAAWGEPRVRLVVAVETVTRDGTSTRAAAPVLVLAPGGMPLPFGATVLVVGRVAPSPQGGREIAVVTAAQAPQVLEPPPAWQGWAQSARRRVRAQAAGVPGDAGALLPGVTVGDTSGVPVDLAQAMRTSGLTHLTAVSGAHFTLVAGLVLGLAAVLRLPRALQVLAALATGAALVVLVQPSPSVLRAAAMGALALGGLLVGRPARAPAALAATVVVLLVADPWLAGELGFVLSVLATGALVLLGPAFVERWSEALGRPVAVALAAPVAAQLVCAPAVLVVQPSVSWVAVPANLAVAPAVAPATILGLLAVLVDPWWPHGGALLARVAGAACWWIAAVARRAAELPGASIAWLTGPAGVLLLVTATVAGTRLLLHRSDSTR
ncbi:ComEC/Rec2 family competence protein [Cellulomonas soli]|uniref:ComEC/Rec2 family competence protein n=1 Tax=Cellulomonas soli TaxID=931535 RepID=UPI003F84F2C5